MISVAHDHSAAPVTVCFDGTRKDFARALSSLGAGMEADDRGTTSWHARRVMLGCSYQRWLSTIGQVPDLVHHVGPGGHEAFQIWEYRCADGSVYCVGRKHRYEMGGLFVSVRAVFVPPHGGPADDFGLFHLAVSAEI